ncbi:hypothetical protein [Zoogloea sp.]|uniref:hypothetical protein n=1 Tax=Zoogloea sp. TaxID=49181 RepID=UPI0026321BE1|nr:hypothetical protein [Zoogloea sp.]MDD3354347.1 hypothetical protein [Zoogloea sp.]
MEDNVPEGTKRLIDGRERVYYSGYWVKTYEVPEDTLQAKRKLIGALTRRLFNHVEHGLNIPGSRLNEARKSYEEESDTDRRRVKGAMLAGALFNRAADIFTKLVELQSVGIEIQSDNALMRECGRCLQEALGLGRLVLHRSGEEGIDELWGEPFKAFSIPLEDFYESRYVKIGLTLRDIDRVAEAIAATFEPIANFSGIEKHVRAFAKAAKTKTETLRTDPEIFDIWTSFVTAAERMCGHFNAAAVPDNIDEQHLAADGRLLLQQGRDLVSYITRARTPMPKSTTDYIERCKAYAERCASRQG